MNKQRIVSLLVCASVALSGCAGGPTQQRIGMTVGGLLGGALGTQVGKGRGRTAAIIAGTLAGAAIGGGIGRTMDEVDRMKVSQALEYTPSNQSMGWSNPDSRAQYSVTPYRTYEVAPQEYCREYSVKALVGGRYQETYGTACRQPDGSWQIRS